VDGAPEPDGILLPERAIEPELAVQLRHQLRGGLFAQEHPRRVPRDEVDEHERDEADQHGHGKHEEDAPPNIRRHLALLNSPKKY
jgi:hypothetical protein